jgi:hypothetical protein
MMYDYKREQIFCMKNSNAKVTVVRMFVEAIFKELNCHHHHHHLRR